jgi:hypothetical protein
VAIAFVSSTVTEQNPDVGDSAQVEFSDGAGHKIIPGQPADMTWDGIPNQQKATPPTAPKKIQASEKPATKHDEKKQVKKPNTLGDVHSEKSDGLEGANCNESPCATGQDPPLSCAGVAGQRTCQVEATPTAPPTDAPTAAGEEEECEVDGGNPCPSPPESTPPPTSNTKPEEEVLIDLSSADENAQL